MSLHPVKQYLSSLTWHMYRQIKSPKKIISQQLRNYNSTDLSFPYCAPCSCSHLREYTYKPAMKTGSLDDFLMYFLHIVNKVLSYLNLTDPFPFTTWIFLRGNEHNGYFDFAEICKKVEK